MKRPILSAIIVCSLASAPLLALASDSKTSESKPRESMANDIKVLQQERLAAYATVLDEAQHSYEVGGDLDQLLSVRRLWLRAFLDVTEQREARIAAVEKHLVFEAKGFDKAQSGWKVGSVNKSQLAEAKAKFLEYKILLLREKSGKVAG